jgi:hypothetical protein
MARRRQQIQVEPSKGYLLVASYSKAYYDAAIRCAISIRDHHHDARIVLFTHADFIKDSDRYLFEEVITGIPYHMRAKLWALDKTPFDINLYLDCDTEIWHDDISKIFDLIGDSDIAITNIREYAGKGTNVSDNEKMSYHCGVFLYKKKNTSKFMKKWWLDYLKQTSSGPWPYPNYNSKMKPWDQFTFWRLLKEEFQDIKISILPDDARWNFIHLYLDSETDKPIVIWHYTIPRGIVDANSIKNTPYSAENIR